jgi:hypothetical protein
MLTQLLQELDKLPPIEKKLESLKHRAQKEPESIQDLVQLIKLATDISGTFDEFPIIEHQAVESEFERCRQILVKQDDYFYI